MVESGSESESPLRLILHKSPKLKMRPHAVSLKELETPKFNANSKEDPTTVALFAQDEISPHSR